MNLKLLNSLLILTSLIGYLECVDSKHMFFFQSEIQIISELISDPKKVIHPFTILPLIGQFILIVTLFQKTPNKWLTLIGMTCISILLLFVLLIGVLSLNAAIFFSAVPFTVVCFLILKLVFTKSKNGTKG